VLPASWPRRSQVSATVSGLSDIVSMRLLEQPFGEIWVVARALAADADVFAARAVQALIAVLIAERPP
jgi:hypothetical protein